jgi:hypothetical protein
VLDALLKSQYDGSEYLPPNFAQDNQRRLPQPHRAAQSARCATTRAGPRPGARSWLLSGQRSDLTSGASATDRFRTERRAWTGS